MAEGGRGLKGLFYSSDLRFSDDRDSIGSIATEPDDDEQPHEGRKSKVDFRQISPSESCQHLGELLLSCNHNDEPLAPASFRARMRALSSMAVRGEENTYPLGHVEDSGDPLVVESVQLRPSYVFESSTLRHA